MDVPSSAIRSTIHNWTAFTGAVGPLAAPATGTARRVPDGLGDPLERDAAGPGSRKPTGSQEAGGWLTALRAMTAASITLASAR
jgi:hypothetical protein